ESLGDGRAVAGPVILLVADEDDVAGELGGQGLEQILLPAEMLVEVAEEGLVITVGIEAMAQGLRRAELPLMAIVDVAALERLAQRVLREPFAPRQRQLANVEQQIDLLLLQHVQKIAELGAFVAEGE